MSQATTLALLFPQSGLSRPSPNLPHRPKMTFSTFGRYSIFASTSARSVTTVWDRSTSVSVLWNTLSPMRTSQLISTLGYCSDRDASAAGSAAGSTMRRVFSSDRLSSRERSASVMFSTVSSCTLASTSSPPMWNRKFRSFSRQYALSAEKSCPPSLFATVTVCRFVRSGSMDRFSGLAVFSSTDSASAGYSMPSSTTQLETVKLGYL